MAETWSLLIAWALGFISAVLSEPVRSWIWGPKLKVEFIEGEKGFITNAKVILGDARGVQVGVSDAHYVRVKVLNTGRQIAKQCCAYLVNVEKWNDSTGKFEPTIYCDSLPLAWSAQNPEEAYRALDIPKDIPQFINIVSTLEGSKKYDVETKFLLSRYEPFFKEQGKFRFTVLVSGDNAKPKSTKLVFEWSGDWDNFTVTAGK